MSINVHRGSILQVVLVSCKRQIGVMPGSTEIQKTKTKKNKQQVYLMEDYGETVLTSLNYPALFLAVLHTYAQHST